MGPLISAAGLVDAIDRVSILDVRWELGKPSQRDAYEQGHIPGAAFLDLESELAAPPGRAGRHPLPEADAFQASVRAAGVSNDRPVVCYDGIAAARAWWLLRYFGHQQVAVLDGGLAAWPGPLETGTPTIEPGDFTASPGGMPILDADAAAELAGHGVLLDARAPERFRGEVEPVDPVAGHIPGARNCPSTENLGPDGGFLDPATLRASFERLGIRDGVAVGAYCGSGVTAAHEVLALELAGFEAALYVGSWSEWITDPNRPVKRCPRAER